MLFNSYTFIIFFILVLVISRLIGGWTWRKAFLLGTSYLFYAAWNPPFVVLLWISTVVDWYISRWMFRATSRHSRRALLLASLFVNLGMLCFFKYGGFITGNANAAMSIVGLQLPLRRLDIILPVGISFYTFQTLSYTLDVYRRRMTPWRSFLDFALYVTFFPQLVAGPIVRASEFLPQCVSPKRATARQLGWGLYMFVVGLFCKVVVADELMSPIVERVFDPSLAPGILTSWTGSVAFSIQIFNDFFGYSTCAIGVALCLGFELPDNFRFPYAARGFSDFWQRWHISLSSWLRDYLYIPLGGNRCGVLRASTNLMVTMLLGGLWHGASWMFVMWGGLHGVYLITERWIVQTRVAKRRIWRTRGGQVLVSFLTFGLVCFTWVFFRAENIQSALGMCRSMLDVGNAVALAKAALTSPYAALSEIEGAWIGINNYVLVAGTATATLLMHHYMRNRSLEEVAARRHWSVNALAVSCMVYLVIISMSGEDNAFIYFQF